MDAEPTISDSMSSIAHSRAAGGGPATTPSASQRSWTTRRLLHWMAAHFERHGIDSPRVCAEMLMASVLGCERLALYMDHDRPATEAERALLRALVPRVLAHEPVQYLVGEAWFFSRPFHVSAATLIPRPSTETLVEEAVGHLRQRWGRAGSSTPRAAAAPMPAATAGAPAADPPASRAPRVLDLCTGTGCVAISIAADRDLGASIVATDCEPAALELARRNARRHGCSNITFAQGDLYEAVGPTESFDLITANPPYVSDAEWQALEPNVRLYEPARALRGGVDGLDQVRRVIEGAADRLAPEGMLLVEIGHSQRDAVEALARSTPGLRDVEILMDHEQFWRILRARRA